MADIPALAWRQLHRLLLFDGWQVLRQTRHGNLLIKQFGDEKRTAVVKNVSRDIPSGTLAAVLSQRQTGLGRDGLLQLIERRGL